jgi:hypothetical protein
MLENCSSGQQGDSSLLFYGNKTGHQGDPPAKDSDGRKLN